jgi:hypothetical protein
VLFEKLNPIETIIVIPSLFVFKKLMIDLPGHCCWVKVSTLEVFIYYSNML